MGRWRWGWVRRRSPPAPPGAGAAPPPPPLAVTLLRLQGALQPLVAPSERARARSLLREFGARGGAGPRLQRRLRGGREEPPRLPAWPWGCSERLPLPVHCSVGLLLPRGHWEHWRGQLGFAARLIAGILDYREQLERRDPPEPWIKAAFGACRVPGPHRDEVLRVHPGAEHPTTIIVSRNGQFFLLELGALSGLPLVAALEEALGGGSGALEPGGGPPPWGSSRGQQRLLWGRVQQLLLRGERGGGLTALNRTAIGHIRRSLVALSLDAPVVGRAEGRGPGGGARQVLTGGGACANSANRWFDKSLQVIVGQDGTSGFLFDPAVIDGASVAAMAEHALQFCRRHPLAAAPVTSPPLPPPRRLRFSLGPETVPRVMRARRQLDSLAADVDVHCFTHEGLRPDVGLSPEALLQVALQAAFYQLHGSLCASCEPTALGALLPGGSDLLRPPPPGPAWALARALQDPHVGGFLLWREMGWEGLPVSAGNGPPPHVVPFPRCRSRSSRWRCCARPWPALGRRRREVRTRAGGGDEGWGRGLSAPRRAPPCGRGGSRGPPGQVLAGQGPERHLQGLREAAEAEGGPLPRLFLDPAYAAANHFRLCSLQVRSLEGCWLLRGPLVPDGYGVGVGGVAPPAPPALNVAVTAFACCARTDAARMGGGPRGGSSTPSGASSGAKGTPRAEPHGAPLTAYGAPLTAYGAPWSPIDGLWSPINNLWTPINTPMEPH
ncbi:LOW QUALITY PROTEIN: carnitine O-acetyltransferase-like [Amazona ochrocephala]